MGNQLSCLLNEHQFAIAHRFGTINMVHMNFGARSSSDALSLDYGVCDRLALACTKFFQKILRVQ